MAYKISTDCVACDNCRPHCPTGAIESENGQYWINAALCDNCQQYTEPQCVISCPLSLPTPAQAKRGRTRTQAGVLASPDLFANGKNQPFASAILVWEACNLLAQRQSLLSSEEAATYQRTLSQGGQLTLSLSNLSQSLSPSTSVESFDIRAACMHLIYAAHATSLDQPWEQEFVISDRQIEEYLGLDKRKDLTKPYKLKLIKELAQQPCLIRASITCPPQGRIPAFTLNDEPLWHLLHVQHYFQEDEEGCKHLVGFTFTLQPGSWTKHFLNRQGCKDRTALYQYSTLPKSLLGAIMSIWQQHEGAARMMLWLLFKVRLGKEQRILVPTLMRIAYGSQKIAHVAVHPEERKRLLRTFESDLEVLNHYGLKPVFDPETYPLEIQPFWAKLVDVPDDAEAALEFWMNDGTRNVRLTDASPRGKWNLLMSARILWFELPPDWMSPSRSREKTETRKSTPRSTRRRFRQKTASTHTASQTPLTAEQVVAARKGLGISQRELAERLGKSQSWIRDIENGRFAAKTEDQLALRSVLGLEASRPVESVQRS
jgi:DNA-binding transcriptional regulator YiaG